MFTIHPTARLRPSPFYESAVAAGMTSASVYNRMLMPTSYGNPEAEYWRIIEGVSMWDVGIERQVQLAGHDALKRHQLGVVLEGDTPDPMGFKWESIESNNQLIGSMTICVFSPRLKKNIGYALVDSSVEPGTAVVVQRQSGPVAGVLQELPFI